MARKKKAKKGIVKRKPLTRSKKRKAVSRFLSIIHKPKKRKVVVMAKKGKRTHRSRSGGIRKKLNVGAMAMGSLAVVGGAIGGAVISNAMPIPDARIKTLIPVVLGIALGSSGLIKGDMGKLLSLGMIAGGALSFARKAFPGVAMIAGEETEDQLLLGNSVDLSGQDELEGQDDELEGQDNELEGQDDELEGQEDDLEGELELMGTGGGSWITE